MPSGNCLCFSSLVDIFDNSNYIQIGKQGALIVSFKNTTAKAQTQKGFTIVELLIVVVVIAILAAISIASYNGITTRANTSAVKSAAVTVEKKAELYNTDSGNNRYPITGAELTAAAASTSYYLSGTTIITTEPVSATGNSTVRLIKCSAAAATTNTQANILASGASAPATQNISGVQIRYWDPSTNSVQSV